MTNMVHGDIRGQPMTARWTEIVSNFPAPLAADRDLAQSTFTNRTYDISM